MPTDETRHLLKRFGVAVTSYEDAITGRAPETEVRAAEQEARDLLREVTALLDRLRAAGRPGRGAPEA